ncbi:tRNA (adenosine(37)-N6)-threonylcarbamoyltransferase complex ATPase subunit type 1 TsaE [Motiliproteus sp. MSK22-1]|uniref:tRNA (adenosine(37)-N6)-threonylcarbamoyltransferase complex ATPase subunit type 1 TsaE n=1 Tax=Motiliproteus sp. MSK22-1 TaxID=1897630 RepID=UPI000976ACB2|nr:tRNA (adenosine(37)-N6)-threonylcarbamoyltransferase complex ATPase subunit type 1 TsaE [Motiliproteus sp. MSK22-1]OMH31872.1 tRNA (adenosine(37)-N6)-threonylcarbamoyltransferase complex ATPase subunit type 1 TsaE [Motiliproteus sp. MSK22-1]
MNDSSEYQIELNSESEMVSFGQRLGVACEGDATLFLRGNLGMGKTTLCRGVLQAHGHSGAVKSPTYTLVEPYELPTTLIYHFDLYRLADPEELEYLGIRDYFSEPAIRLIEWPDQGAGELPEPDLALQIERNDEGRIVVCEAKSLTGRQILNRLRGNSVEDISGAQYSG